MIEARVGNPSGGVAPAGLEGHTLIHGIPIVGPTRKMLAHFHMLGPSDDGVVLPETIVEYAEEHGYDILPTPHNSLRGYERALRFKENGGYNGFEMVPGQEYAAIDPHTGKHSHTLVLGIDTELAPGMSREDANRKIARLGGIAIAAHPGLGSISVSHEEIVRINQHPDPEVRYQAVEVYNAAIPSVASHGETLRSAPKPFVRLGKCIADRNGFPQHDLNERTATFMRQYAGQLELGYFAGTDSHNLEQLDDVVLTRPASMTPIDAIRQGAINIYIKNDPDIVSLGQFAGIRASNIAGKALGRIPALRERYINVR